MLSLLDAAPLPPDFQELLSAYGPGAVPGDRGETDAPLDALVDRLTRTGELRAHAVESMSAERLAGEIPDPLLAQTQPTLAHHLEALLFHEGYHAGQLSAWRRSHGLAPVRWVLAPEKPGGP